MISHLSFPSAWMTGWKNGWHQPTNTAAGIGHHMGHNALAALIIVAFAIFVVVKLARGRS